MNKSLILILARYPTDLTDTEWAVLAPLIPAAKAGGRPRTSDMREVVNAIFYVLHSGCRWRLLPKDFRLTRRSTITFEAGGSWGHGTRYTTDCAAMCGKPMAAIGSRALELSTARR
jgi:transposase